MRAFADYDKRMMITDAITNQTPITYEILKNLREHKRLEDYDLFKVVDDRFDNIYIYYIESEDAFYVIDISETTSRLVKEEHLKKETYIIKTRGNNSIYENAYQDFINRSKKNFNELTKKEQMQVILGKYMGLELERTIDGLINSLKDVVDILKDEKEGEASDNRK